MLCHRNKRNEIHAISDLWISSFLFQVFKFQVDKFFANWALRQLSGWNSRRSSVLPWNLQVICGSGHSLNKCLSVWARSTRIRSRLWGGEQKTLFAFCTPNGQDQASRSSGDLDGPWRPLVINIFSQNRDKYYLQILSHVCSCLKTPRQNKPLAGS